MRQWPGVPVLVAIRIVPETGIKGLIEGKAFVALDGSTDYAAMLKWVADRQGGIYGWANIYFHPNGLREAKDKKATLEDVKAMQTLHVDVDVPPGGNQEAEIAKIVELLKQLRDKDGNLAPPSDIIISGGGAQGYWRLGAPVPVDGNLDICEDLKLYNKHVELELGGDHCHSLDHIMRLPGTVNIPDVKKIAAGRVPRLATWAYHDANKRYSLNQFVKAAPEDKAKFARANSKDWDIKWSQEVIASNDDRLRGLSEAWKVLGVEGDTLNEYRGADGKTDRSNMAFAFVTACMRCSPPVTDEVIVAILMDKGWKVGECIRDKGATVKRHLNRIIERGRKFVAEDVEKDCYIDIEKPDEIMEKLLIRVLSKGVLFWRGEWYLYDGLCWHPIDERSMRQIVRKFLRTCKIKVCAKVKEKDDKGKVHIKTGTNGQPELDWKTEDCAPTRNMVTEVLDSLCDQVNLNPNIEMPCWLEPEDDSPDPRECMRVRNGILHIPTRRTIDHDSNLFSTSITSYDYDPSAKCPTWLTTLGQYWPASMSEDGVSAMLEPMLLQEMFAYSLTPWTSLQKILAVVGPGRSGKGTISKTLEEVVGKDNIAAPSFKALGTQFGQQSLINKQLAVIGEAAFGMKDDRAEITNFLKTVSGEDTVNIPRKFLLDWKGKLIAKFWLFCNQIPDFLDAGKAIMARMLPLKMVRSWAGKENEHLAAQLALELSGILNWALDGYDRLKRNDGKFTMPNASMATKELFGDLASPLNDFLNEWCAITGEDEHFVRREDLYLAYQNWCEAARVHPKQIGRVIQMIVSLDPEKMKESRKGVRGQERPRTITGIQLIKVPKQMKYGASGMASAGADHGVGLDEREAGQGDKGAPEIPF